MKIDKILTDTNIWHYSYIEPIETDYIELHNKANKFLSLKISDENTVIYLSNYQIAEMLEMLRKGQVDIEKRNNLLEDYKSKPKKFRIINFGIKIIQECYEGSKKSNIHIYDYLIAYPLKRKINKIYSADDHFQHKNFTSICEVINPLQPWILREGRKPIKQENNSNRQGEPVENSKPM